jgi:hypothetical protein
VSKNKIEMRIQWYDIWILSNHGYFQVMDRFSHGHGVIVKIQSRNIKDKRYMFSNTLLRCKVGMSITPASS